MPPEDGANLIVTANVDHVVNLTRVTEFRDAYNFAWLIVADGAPIYAYARLRGIPLIERITGADLFLDLVTQFDQRHRPFFVASTEEAAQRTLGKLAAAGSCTEHFAYVVPPFGFDEDEALREHPSEGDDEQRQLQRMSEPSRRKRRQHQQHENRVNHRALDLCNHDTTGSFGSPYVSAWVHIRKTSEQPLRGSK